MNSIQVNSLPLHKVVQELAKAFGTYCKEHCEEYSIEIPPNFGEGLIRGVNFNNGLSILQYDCIFKKDLAIEFSKNTIHPLKFLYCTEGFFEHSFENHTKKHQIQQYQRAIVASDNHNGHILWFKANTRTCIFSLEILRKKFRDNLSCELKSLHNGLEKLFLDVDAKYQFYHEGQYSLQLADSFEEMTTFVEECFLRKIFFESKAYQILLQQILEYQDDIKNDKSILRKSEVKMIKKAVEIINNEINDLGTITELAETVGLNANKLQDGFQHLYQLSVNQYIKKTRLDLAKNLLMNTDYSISEIVFKIGLNSKSYFSKIFKEEYSITPSKLRKPLEK